MLVACSAFQRWRDAEKTEGKSGYVRVEMLSMQHPSVSAPPLSLTSPIVPGGFQMYLQLKVIKVDFQVFKKNISDKERKKTNLQSINSWTECQRHNDSALEGATLSSIWWSETRGGCVSSGDTPCQSQAAPTGLSTERWLTICKLTQLDHTNHAKSPIIYLFIYLFWNRFLLCLSCVCTVQCKGDATHDSPAHTLMRPPAHCLLQVPLTTQLSNHCEVERSPLAKRIHRWRLAER